MPSHRRRTLASVGVAAAATLSALGKTVVLPYNDPRIQYSHPARWAFGGFSIPDGQPLPPVSGPNSSVCELGQNSTYTAGLGEAFSLDFSGVRAQLVVVSRSDHGVVAVAIDGNSTTIDTYSVGENCGVAFDSGPLANGSHAFGAVLVARDPASPDDFQYFELLSIILDDGVPESASPSASSAPPVSSSPPSTQGASSHAPSRTGLAVGCALGGFAAGMLALVIVFSFMRRKGGDMRAPPAELEPWQIEPHGVPSSMASQTPALVKVRRVERGGVPASVTVQQPSAASASMGPSFDPWEGIPRQPSTGGSAPSFVPRDSAPPPY